MGALYWSAAPLPSEEALPALRATLEAAFPHPDNRAYLAGLWGGDAKQLPPRVAVARLCALSLLPALLAEGGLCPEELILGRDENGRPFGRSADPRAPSFDFNLSHANGHAACALLVGNGHVGVDMEELIPPARALRLLDRYGTEGERAGTQDLPDQQKALAFTRIWTIREALCKQDGQGMPLRYDAARIPEEVRVRSGQFLGSGTVISLCWPAAAEIDQPVQVSDFPEVAWFESDII